MLLPLLLAACSSTSEVKVTDYLTPYRIDIRQGNFVSQEMAAQLKPGITKEQVRYLLGTPLIADPFHADRWDYVYRFQTGKGEDFQQRQLSVFFQEGKLLRVGGDVAGQEPGQVEAQPASPAARVIDIAADPNAVKDAAKEDAKSSKRWYWPF
ncbi:outer membrane protein assembly factor BamE [Denitratisoma sp. DHT3]|uniref:outer membrane protein assembly factor BamE n=1 Tax=Denitratisoma sp. DHT3 TaxID=1981880 RepID=UPI0021BDD74E|nr:outer membrane protein assembly factor BamE [Denitratisoma sp. DHT3]